MGIESWIEWGGSIAIKQGNLNCCVEKEQRRLLFLCPLKKCWYKLMNGEIA